MIRLCGNDVSLDYVGDRNILYAAWMMRRSVEFDFGIFHVVCECHWIAEEREGIRKRSRLYREIEFQRIKEATFPEKRDVGAELISNGVTQLIGPAQNPCLYSLHIKLR